MSTQEESNSCNDYSTSELVNYELIGYKHVEVMQIQGFKIPALVKLNCFRLPQLQRQLVKLQCI